MIYVEKFVQKKPDGFQDLVWQRRFSDLKRANAFVAKYAYKLRSVDAVELYQMNPITEKYLTEAPDKVLWTHNNNWSWDWEVKYAQWVRENIHQDFLVKYNIKTDCADLAYVSRWIFARLNSLPMANRLGGSGQILSNFSMRSEWLKLPTNTEWFLDKRFLAALDYLMNNTYTHTLARDSYPIAITPESLIPGVHHLVLHDKSGHTMYVYSTLEHGQVPLKLYFSNVPRIVRPLYETSYYQSNSPNRKLGEGFLRFVWPAVTAGSVQFVKREQMPFFSEQQYDPAFIEKDGSFDISVMKKLDPNFSWENLVLGSIKDVKSRIEERIPVVEQGYTACQKTKCTEESQAYDDWSTPSRDARILEIFNLLTTNLNSMEGVGFVGVATEALKNDTITVEGRKISLADVLVQFKYKNYSSDPNVPIGQRWGLSVEDQFANIKFKIAALMNARKLFLAQAANCKKDCLFGSKNWASTLSYSSDFEIKSVFEGVQHLKVKNPEKYAQLKLLLDSVQQDGKTLTEWSQKFEVLNADPKYATDFVDKKSTWTAFNYLADSRIAVSTDKKVAFLKSETAGQIVDLITGVAIFDDNPVDGKVISMNAGNKSWLTILDQDQSKIFKVFQNDKKLAYTFAAPIAEAILEAKIVSSENLGDYVFVQTEKSFQGFSVLGQKLFNYVFENAIPSYGRRLELGYFQLNKQICVFNLSSPLEKKCQQIPSEAESVDISAAENEELVNFETRIAGSKMGAFQNLTYHMKTNSFLSFPKDATVNIFSNRGGSVYYPEKKENFYFTVGAKGEVILGKKMSNGIYSVQLSDNLYGETNYEDASPTTAYYQTTVNGGMAVVNLKADEERIGSAVSFNNETYLLVLLKNSLFRVRQLNGSFAKDIASVGRPTLFVKGTQLFLSDKVLIDSEHSINLSYTVLVNLNGGETFQVVDTNFFSSMGSSLDLGPTIQLGSGSQTGQGVDLPSGFTISLSEKESIPRLILGLKTIGVYLYQP